MTLDAHLTSLGLDKAFHQSKAQPGAIDPVADSIEPAEHSRKILLGYAFAGISHANVDAPDMLVCLNRNAAAAISVAYRVRQKVIENAGDRSAVPDRP